MMALAETVAEFTIPIAPFEALISAFEQDQVVSDYATYAQLLDYCSRSANPVGHLVLYLAGSYDEENARLSDLTCTGLQLANFWQDVVRDLAIGRIYLPREDRERFEVADLDLRHCALHRPSRACSRSRSSGPEPCYRQARRWFPGCLAPCRSTSISSSRGPLRSSTGSRRRGTTS